MDEQLKQQFFPPVVVFNLTTGIYLLARMFTHNKNVDFPFFWKHLLIGAAVGLVLGGITLFFTMRKK